MIDNVCYFVRLINIHVLVSLLHVYARFGWAFAGAKMYHKYNCDPVIKTSAAKMATNTKICTVHSQKHCSDQQEVIQTYLNYNSKYNKQR